MMRIFLIIILSWFVILISCNNEEKQIAGVYLLDSCNVDTLINEDSMPQNITLLLHTNNTFEIEAENIHLRGKWKYYDTGDRAIVSLYKEDSDFENQMSFGITEDANYLTVANPNILFNRDNINYIQFKCKSANFWRYKKFW